MSSAEKTQITVNALVNKNIEKVWAHWNQPEHITKWCFASDDWHAPSASNDLQVGGKFTTRMEARDGSFGFDFEGIYQEVEVHQKIIYGLEDGRNVKIIFESQGDNATHITETFDAENENPIEMQQQGWQSILNNFKKYSESQL